MKIKVWRVKKRANKIRVRDSESKKEYEKKAERNWINKITVSQKISQKIE